MAFQNTTRSFSNLGITASTNSHDKTDMGSGTLGPNFGSASTVWGSSNIWSHGGLSSSFASRTATRDNSQSRETGSNGHKSKGVGFEGKTGSGSLVESSISEDPRYKSWPGKRGGPSASQTQASNRSSAQQRSVNNAGLQQVYPGASQSGSSRPPTISLTTSSAGQQRSTFASTFGNGLSSRGLDHPPTVYTKFDRPSDPSYGREKQDSAVHWDDRPKLPSPTEERKPLFSTSYSSRNNSLAASREPSQPPSRYADSGLPGSDFTTSTQGTTPLSSRNQSLSSQRNGVHFGYGPTHADVFVPQFGQMSLQDEQRPSTAQKAFNSARCQEQSALSNYGGTYSKYATDGMADSLYDDSAFADETEDVNRPSSTYTGYGSLDHSKACYTPCFQDYPAQSHAAHFPVPTNGVDWGYGRSHATSPMSPKSYDPPSGPRSQFGLPAYQHGTPLTVSKRDPVAVEQHHYYDPRMPSMMAMQARNPYAFFNPYAVPNALQVNGPPPFYGSNMMPISMTGMELQTTSRDVAPVEAGVQSALMYEFKTNNKTNKRYELKDIFDHIAEFSGDQHGSRLIQQKLETANSDDKERVFREIQPNAIQLMTDVFGNYVIQKFFEHGDQSQKKILASQMENKVLSLSLQMYGCRVVQKALEHILVDQQAQLIREIDGNVLRCVKDQNGNHVVQKAIERCPSQTINFIIAAFQGQVQHLSIHPYGCRVIQRCLEHCDPHSKALIMVELHESMSGMIADQYGNYVVQHVVEHGGPEDKKRVLNLVFRGLESYSRHKFASNVVEKCLECASPEWRNQVLYAFVSANQRREGEGLVGMIKDSYGNYVIQKLLDTLSGPDYAAFLQDLQQAMNMAKRTGCGKQVVAIEKKMHEFRYKLLSPASQSQYPQSQQQQQQQQHQVQSQHQHRQQLQLQWQHGHHPGGNRHGHGQGELPPNGHGQQQRTLCAPPLRFQQQQGFAGFAAEPGAVSAGFGLDKVPSINGDAVEGAATGSRKGSEGGCGFGGGNGSGYEEGQGEGSCIGRFTNMNTY
ncbi:hypothetical protein MBLNU230_g7044t1 [Neophaeotheca triangularis]